MSEAPLYLGSPLCFPGALSRPNIHGVVQWYLTHKKMPPTRTLSWAYASGPTVLGGRFLMGEVPLYRTPSMTT